MLRTESATGSPMSSSPAVRLAAPTAGPALQTSGSGCRTRGSTSRTRASVSSLRRIAAHPLEELCALALLDRPAPETPLPGAAVRLRRSRVVLLRRSVQVAFLLITVWIGWQFARWVYGLEAGRIVGARPPGVEGFLPIAAFMSLRYWVERGIFTSVHPAGLAIFVSALALGLLAKKAFCSWVCPVGAISEGLARVSRAIFRAKLRFPRALDLPLRSLKYLLLAFFAWVIVIKMSAEEVGTFLTAPYSRVADIKMFYFFGHVSKTAAIVLASLAVLSTVVPYFWCRYLCPYGGLLGLLSLLSPLKVTRHAPSCIECGLCTRACPSHLPVEKLTRVRSDECFGCLSCVAACPVPRALRMETPKRWRRAVRPAAFAALVLILFAGGITLARLSGHWRTSITDAEYVSRIHEINGPQYTHVQGTMGTRR